MGLITNRPSGPDFNQDETPTARPDGGIWWQRKTNAMSGCNGAVWGGEYGFGDEGFALSAGGYGSGAAQSTIDKLQFSDESTSVLGSTLTSRRSGNAGVQTDDIGYAAYGWDGAVTVSSVDRISFSALTVSAVTSSMPSTLGEPSGVYSEDKGYFTGNSVTTVHTLTFSNEASAVSGLTNPQTAGELCAGMQSNSAGYIVGGNPGSDPFLTTIRKLTFSPEAFTTISTGLTTGVSRAATPRSSSAGYVTSGRVDTAGNHTTAIQKFTFDSESIAQLTTGIGSACRGAATSFTTSAGYIMGGFAGSGVYLSVIQKIKFLDDSVSTIGSALSLQKNGLAGFSYAGL